MSGYFSLLGMGIAGLKAGAMTPVISLVKHLAFGLLVVWIYPVAQESGTMPARMDAPGAAGRPCAERHPLARAADADHRKPDVRRVGVAQRRAQAARIIAPAATANDFAPGGTPVDGIGGW